MLRGLRKASSNWLGKVVMAAVVGFLVISFAIWGIGDIFRGFGRSTVAKVGRTEITVEQFRTLYNERLQQFSRQLRRPISMEQARAMGLDRTVIRQLVSEILLDEAVRKLDLNISDAEVVREITNDPTFRGATGQFDHFRFEQMIRSAGYTEARYVAEQRRHLLRRQLATTITSGTNAPKALVEAANNYQNEQRSIEYLLLDRAVAGEIPSATPEALGKYFEERKNLFRAPEYRKLVIMSLIPAEQAQWIEISDADLQRAYEERRARYVTPEHRHVQQIAFPSSAAAEQAAQRIAQGTSFEEMAKELGKTEKDIDLGSVTKAGMIDRAVADAAFALKDGEVSAPIQGRFGPVLVRVLKIEPEQVRPFQDVANELKQELAMARAKAEVLKLYDQIEDSRGEGKSLAETVEQLKVPARIVEAVDRSGRDASGVPIQLPDEQRLLQAAFSTDVGVEHDPLQSQDGYIWFDVVGITPSRERTLDEVKEQVEQRWREEEIATRLSAKATEILEKVQAGSSLADAGAADHLKVEIFTGLKRSEDKGPPTPLSPPPNRGPLSAAGVDAVFRIPKDGAGKADAAKPPEQVVFRVTDIVVPGLDAQSSDAKSSVETLNRAVSEDVVSEYIARLEKESGVSINQNALNQATGGAASGDLD
jgi:peptidyl-prolyl cis-trans isomerase D